MKVLITGAQGFIGKNLQLRLSERENIEAISFTRADDIRVLPKLIKEVDFVFHLAGVNRPKDSNEFITGNTDLTAAVCEAICTLFETTGKIVPILYTSSIQVEGESLYSLSKRKAENLLFTLGEKYKIPIYIFRLPNVFGKWSKPNYNSVVATFCYNVCRDIPIHVEDPKASITLIYIDDLIDRFIQIIDDINVVDDSCKLFSAGPEYITTVGDLALSIQSFRESRKTLTIDRVGSGLTRALYSTYISYLPPRLFAYEVPQYNDLRGTFVEVLKTPDAGQFSIFTAHPGITRGGHYHHSKTEKFLVIQGQALFKFRHVQTDEIHELIVTGRKSEIVETIPGWTHDITNIGTEELVVMLWANEVFDRARPDTFACPL